MSGEQNYNLLNYNCNQQVRKVLAAGGKDFAPAKFDGIKTRPNSVYSNIVQSIRNGEHPGWLFGTMDDLKAAYEECGKNEKSRISEIGQSDKCARIAEISRL